MAPEGKGRVDGGSGGSVLQRPATDRDPTVRDRDRIQVDVPGQRGGGSAPPRGPPLDARYSAASGSANSLSSLIGASRTRIPVACQTALVIAPAVPVMPISPTPLMPSALT